VTELSPKSVESCDPTQCQLQLWWSYTVWCLLFWELYYLWWFYTVWGISLCTCVQRL